MSYQRILLKLSGESFADRSVGGGLDPDATANVARQVANVVRMGVEVAVVVGGGNILRGAKVAGRSQSRASADYMGMLGTVINALALSDAIEALKFETRVLTAIEIAKVAEPFVRRRALAHLAKGRVVILAAGTGNPFFSTDTAAALRARELACDALLKATKVDGVYTADPVLDPKATRIDALTHQQFLDLQLRVMDATAVSLAQESNLPIVVFDVFQDGNIERVVRGQAIGTTIRSKP
ncbi:MAG: UMP kinase [Planctomycetes bacterium]|jgi:uridylate kinase|nr:UMP kinase [Planctomycetota bacterium]